MGHSAMVLLFGADGRLFEPIGYQEDADRAAGKIDRLLAGDPFGGRHRCGAGT